MKIAVNAASGKSVANAVNLSVLASLMALSSATADAQTAVNADTVGAQQPGVMAPDVRVRDVNTGRALPARLTVRSLHAAAQQRSLDIAAAGVALGALPAGEHLLSIEAAGYQSMATTITVDNQPKLPTTIWMQPTTPDLRLEQSALRAVQCGDCSVITGYVYDSRSGKPLPGLAVRSDQGDATHTDAAGRFELQAVAPRRALADVEALPATTTITIEGDGYSEQLSGIGLYNDASDLIIDAVHGGAVRRDMTHVQSLARRNNKPREQAPQDTVESLLDMRNADVGRDQAMRVGDPAAASIAARLAAQAATIPVPSTIRVGTNCSGRSCTGVSVYTLEDYVGRGLDDEWIASWRAASLAAGAVVYRSYGAYFVAHPVSSRYDICSTTSCQVFRAGSSSSTLAAAAATKGVILTRDGRTAAFSEYSSENNAWNNPNDGLSCVNNDLSCGNGRNGSPRNGWPCLSDSVGKGRGCFGHGRGMSQWGSQRWAAQSQNWQWITNHYFNANNNPGGMRNAFLANVGAPSSQYQILDTFESSVGHFRTSPTYSGSTKGISSTSTLTRDCNRARAGKCSLHLLANDDPRTTANWEIRLLSGVGEPAANPRMTRKGRVGVWVYPYSSGASVQLSIDDSDGTERSTARAVPGGKWTYVSWDLERDADWNAWAGNGNGRIDAATVTLDAIWLLRPNIGGGANFLFDQVQLHRK